MKFARLYLAALLMAGSLIASAAPVFAEEGYNGSWQAHVRELRKLRQDQD